MKSIKIVGSVVLASLLLTGCGGEDGTNGVNGEDGSTILSLLKIESLAPDTETCVNGGQIIYSGLDLNENGVLDDEITDSLNVCNGINGTDGTNGTNGTDGKDGINGTNGTNGSDGKDGIDGTDGTNGSDGKDGIDGTDGTNGTNGEDGLHSLIKLTPEAEGKNCDFGGQRIDIGPDINGDLILDDDEIIDTQYVCNSSVLSENHLDFKSIAQADWDLEDGLFISKDPNSGKFKWTPKDPNGYANLAAAVYNAADWNAPLKDLAYQEVIRTQEAVNAWDLLVYDVYANVNLYTKWIIKYGLEDGSFNPEKIRQDWRGYDTYGVIIGLYRAYGKGLMTQETYNKSIDAIKTRLLSFDDDAQMPEYHYAFFKLVEMETGDHVHDYPQTVDTTDFDGQYLGFATKAYGSHALGTTDENLTQRLNRYARVADNSLRSIDALAGYYSLTQVDINTPISNEAQKELAHDVMVRKDWNLDHGAFVLEDGFKWTRTSGAASKNIAAAIYNAATWNKALLNESREVVLANKNNPLDWDLLVYDTYTKADLFDAWIAEFGNDGVFDAGPNKSRPNRDNIRETWGAYDAYGKVIGMYRALQQGVMTQANFDKSVENITQKLATYTWSEADNSYFKLIFDATGKKVHDYPATIDVTEFDAQELGFAVQAYDLNSIIGSDQEELEQELLNLAKDSSTSLESIDALAGFNFIHVK